MRRIYSKNRAFTGLRYSTRLYVGDYAFSNRMDELAQNASGVRRLGVCRMDVDDLGRSFVSGYERPGRATAAETQHYVTISRTAAFSRQMSLFSSATSTTFSPENTVVSGRWPSRSFTRAATTFSSSAHGTTRWRRVSASAPPSGSFPAARSRSAAASA